MKISMSWSGGKDSAYALYRILNDPAYEVVHLHSVIDEATGRLPMHEVSAELIKRQAEAIGLPLKMIFLPAGQSNDTYEARMKRFVSECQVQGVEALAYGDIFLEDLRQYRESMLKSTGLKALFPLWDEPTEALIQTFIKDGFKTCICAVNDKFLKPGHLGKTIDEEWVASLPSKVDPCGENGEYHSFTYDGPVYRHPVKYAEGKIFSRNYPDPSAAGERLTIHYLPVSEEKEKS